MKTELYVSSRDRAEGGMLGLLIGARWVTRMQAGSPLVHGGGAAQALVMADCLGRTKGRHLDSDDLCEGLNRWQQTGALSASSAVEPAASISGEIETERRPDPHAHLARVLPLALWFRGPMEYAVQAAMDQALIVVDDEPPTIACAQLSLWARRIYVGEEIEAAWASAIADIEKIAPSFQHIRGDLLAAAEWLRTPTKNAKPGMDFLLIARDCLKGAVTFEEAAARANASPENDEGALGALVGGLAGIRIGRAALPQKEIETLLASDDVQRAVAMLGGRADDSGRLTRLPPKTSSSHPLQISSMPFAGGTLALTECPGASNQVIGTSWGPQWVRRDLREDLQRLRDLGVDAMVTLLEPDEIIDGDLGNIMGEAQAVGIDLYHLPLARDATPDEYADGELKICQPKLSELLSRGGTLVLHAGDWFDERLKVGALWIAQAIKPEVADEELEPEIETALDTLRELIEALD